MKKKYLAYVLSATMLASMMPTSVYAEVTGTGVDSPVVYAAAGSELTTEADAALTIQATAGLTGSGDKTVDYTDKTKNLTFTIGYTEALTDAKVIICKANPSGKPIAVDTAKYQTEAQTLAGADSNFSKTGVTVDIAKLPVLASDGKYVAVVESATKGKYSQTGVEFKVNKATGAVTWKQVMNREYTGQAATEPAKDTDLTVTGDGTVTYEYYTDKQGATPTNADNSGAASEKAAPKKVGNYFVKAVLADGTNYTGVTSDAKEFNVTKADPKKISVGVSGKNADLFTNGSAQQDAVLEMDAAGPLTGFAATITGVGTETGNTVGTLEWKNGSTPVTDMAQEEAEAGQEKTYNWEFQPAANYGKTSALKGTLKVKVKGEQQKTEMDGAAITGLTAPAIGGTPVGKDTVKFANTTAGVDATAATSVDWYEVKSTDAKNLTAAELATKGTPVSGKFAAQTDKQYVAKVVLTAPSGKTFAEGAKTNITGLTGATLKDQQIDSGKNTLTFLAVYDAVTAPVETTIGAVTVEDFRSKVKAGTAASAVNAVKVTNPTDKNITGTIEWKDDAAADKPATTFEAGHNYTGTVTLTSAKDKFADSVAITGVGDSVTAKKVADAPTKATFTVKVAVPAEKIVLVAGTESRAPKAAVGDKKYGVTLKDIEITGDVYDTKDSTQVKPIKNIGHWEWVTPAAKPTVAGENHNAKFVLNDNVKDQYDVTGLQSVAINVKVAAAPVTVSGDTKAFVKAGTEATAINAATFNLKVEPTEATGAWKFYTEYTNESTNKALTNDDLKTASGTAKDIICVYTPTAENYVKDPQKHTVSVTVTDKTVRTLRFAAAPSVTYGDDTTTPIAGAALTDSAQATSGKTEVKYAVAPTGVVEIDAKTGKITKINKAGTVTITAKADEDAKNSLTAAEGSYTLDVKKAPLNVTVKATPAKVQVNATQEPAYSYAVTESDLKNGDQANVVTGTAKYEYTNGKTFAENVKAAGTYDVTVKDLTAENYELKIKNATLTVENGQVPDQLQAPSITNNRGSVTITNANGKGKIYYTTDNATPTAHSTEYVSPFNVLSGTTVKAIVIDGGSQSAVAEKLITFSSSSSGGSSSGGGSSSSTTKSEITVSKDSHGKVELSKKDAKPGDTVYVTATPDKGYEVDKVVVKDKNGKEIKVKKNAYNEYFFTMPKEGKVEVEAIFVREGEKKEEKEETTKKDPIEMNTITNRTFNDVRNGDWFKVAVDYVVSEGIMSGVGDGSFAPNQNMTRAMVWQVLAKIDGVNTVGGAQWYSKAMDWAKAHKITDGSNVNGKVTREQIASMLYRYAKDRGVDVSVKGTLANFPDAKKVNGYATEAMQWAVGAGLINGMDGRLNPQGNATRAQVATMLMNFDKLIK